MINIDIGSKSKKWQPHLKFIEDICKKLISSADLKKFFKKDPSIEVAVSLILDREMQKINHQFRGKDKTTNVLSFPAQAPDFFQKNYKENYVFLGDIIISFETVKKESLAEKKSFENHLTHMILHSILHLIGFDHQNKKEAKVMESLEVKILKQFKIPNPYS
jgi:probable rRNA maturation factor